MAVNWVDRVPTNPNRMKITPENGSPYYATVERADNPSVEGTPVNARNLNAMQDAAGLSANKTVYVSTSGSDSVGDGSAANPYATINKALSTIPKNLNGFTATVNIAAGTYTENATIQNFGNGVLTITGTAGDVITLSGMWVYNCQYVEINNISLQFANAYLNVYCSNLRVTSPVTAGNSNYGVYCGFFANVVCSSTVTVNNTTNYAVVSTSSSRIYIQELLGTGNKMSVASTLGGVCVLGKDSSTTSGTQYFTDTGGRILMGSQTQVPNY